LDTTFTSSDNQTLTNDDDDVSYSLNYKFQNRRKGNKNFYIHNFSKNSGKIRGKIKGQNDHIKSKLDGFQGKIVAHGFLTFCHALIRTIH
jgi:hypothetical protein